MCLLLCRNPQPRQRALEERIAFRRRDGAEPFDRAGVFLEVFWQMGKKGATAVIKRELNLLRRNRMAGQELLKSLGEIYYHHNLQERLERQNLQREDNPIPSHSRSFQI